MSQKLGFYELLEPYFTFGLAAQNANGLLLRNLRDANASLQSSFPGAGATLSELATRILDYLSVEELHTAVGDSAIVMRGIAKFGGEGRANPELPPSQSLASSNGQELSWQDQMMAFRMTIPRRGADVALDTSGLSGNELTDLQQLNTLLDAFGENPAGGVSDQPANDFRLELLIRSVRLALPSTEFIPARIAADGWLEPDPNIKQVVLEFPQLAFVLEQQGAVGNLKLKLKSWSSEGFDDPGNVDTGRLFTLTPPFFLHHSRYVGFGIEKLVADFSNDVTPPEILEQFGTGDDFNGIWLPLVQIFIAPGRTTGLAISARGKDLLFDFDKGFSGEIALDLLNRGGQLEVEPVFYQKNAKTPLELTRGAIERKPDGTTEVKKGSIQIPGDGELHLSIRGSSSPYQVSIQFKGSPFAPDTSDGVNRPKWIIPASESGILSLDIRDQGNKNRWLESIEVSHVGLPGPGPAPRPKYMVLFTPGNGDPEHLITLDEELTGDQAAVLRLSPDFPVPVLQVILPINQVIPRRPDGTYRMILTPGDRESRLVATWQTAPDPPASDPLPVQDQIDLVKQATLGARLYFDTEYPLKPAKTPAAVVDNLFQTSPFFGNIGLSPNDFSASREAIVAHVQNFLNATQGNIVVSGFASFEKGSNFPDDETLSEKRAEILQGLIQRLLGSGSGRSVSSRKGYSHDAAEANDEQDSDSRFRVVIASAAPATPPRIRAATVQLVDITPPPAPDPPVEHPPQPQEPERPPIFRRLGFRVRFQRNEWVLGEISGQFDFRTTAEETAGFIQVNDPRNSDEQGNANSAVAEAVQTPPGASASGEQGILDYRLTISYDTATRRLSQVLALGFDQQGRDGWVNIQTFNPSKLANTLGSLLVFAPLLNAGIDSAVNAEGTEAVVNTIIAGAEVAIATTLGLTGALKFQKFTLFGIELSATEILADGEIQEDAQLGNLAALFDYAVDFEVNINLGILTIRSKRDVNNNPVPVRVRYRGFGFRLNFQDTQTYEAVFDTSRGFDLGLAEPGALEVGGPLGPLLRVDSVRVARQNPLILELDLGLNANLGVISVDSVRVRMPIEPPGIPTIIPTGISVNIPGALVGSGFLDIRDSGFTGAIDVTLVPLKLRVQASVGLQNLEEGNRRITAFFLGLGVEFPAPIPLANSGLGLYGLLGLFGMHYKRDEEAPINPNLPIALDWFYNKAKGEPHLIAVDGRPTWVAAPDRWSFGVGVVLGTMEGAFILNLKGMLVLELPGPRILVFVKAQIFVPRPPSGKPADQSAGILAVVDLNFQVGYIAIGLIFTYEIKELLKIEVPIDTQFSFHDIEDWHLYIGSLRNKASADILGIAKGTAYLMFDGKGIPDFPLGALNGFSIAAGIAASLVLGDEDSGLYARVSGSVDVGVSTAPLHFYGRMRLEGRIHLWILGLGASAQLDIEAPEPLYVKGEVCGSIDLWLTELKGCVGITIGNPHPLPDPEPLLTGLSLQSHSPALLEGQGAETPIDSSLGVSHNAGEVIPNIPIDSIPVLQMKYPPVFKLGSTGLKPSSTAPTLVPGSDGWFSLGGLPGQEGERQLRYEISNISISPALPAAQPEMPATWWQPSRPNAPADSQSADKGVNLALNSWIPIPFPRAYQRSEEQRRTIRNRFEVICRLIAPATAVLWTFNEQRAGYSPTGWTLRGLPWPDPPNTQRSQAPETNLQVHEAEYPYRNHLLVLDYAAKLSGQVLDPAKVVPSSSVADVGRALQLPFLAFFTGMANENSLSDEARALAKTFLDQAGNRERIVLESGDVAVVRLLLCGHVKQKVLAFTRIRAFDVKNNIVEDIPVPGIFVRRYEDLPASWRDNSGPWAAGVSRVFNFLADVYKGTHQLFLAEWKPKAPIARFELYYQLEGESQKREWTDPPALLLGVTETLTRAEVERVVSEESYQDDMVQVVVNSLEEGDKRPLFAPNTEYTVRVNYQGQIRKGSDTNTVKTKNFEQSFKFRTASLSPKRIHPWVLAMLPENDAGNHFTKDKVQFIFNDAAVIQLFKAYGKTLKAVLRKANGNHPSEQPAIDLPALQGVQALVLSPYVHSMLALVKEMPCIPQLIETEQHQVFTVDIPLERGSSYMLDIESTPAAEDPNTPLFRTAFTTSRFESAAELAAIVAQGGIGELPLRGALVLPDKNLAMLIPDDDAPSRTRPVSVPWVSDAEMEAALLLALESDLPPAKQPGATLLWSFGQPATPLAVLLDAPEPLMRSRPVPVEVETPTPDDDAIQHFQTGKQLWLEVVESGLSLAERIVYSTSGCRVLVFLKSGASGTMQLALRQYRHTLLTGEAPFADVSLLEMPIPQKAPWEY